MTSGISFGIMANFFKNLLFELALVLDNCHIPVQSWHGMNLDNYAAKRICFKANR